MMSKRAVAVAVAVAGAAWMGLMAPSGSTATATVPRSAPAVLKPVADSAGSPQSPGQVAAALDKFAKDKSMGKSAGTLVIDATTGDTVYDDDGGTPLVPASTNKIPTAVGVLRSYGGDKRLTTTVGRQGSTIYLVGAGDPLLVSVKPKAEPGAPIYPSPTSMVALADDTAAALKSAGLGSVQLRIDDTLFSGPDWGPEWPEYFRTQGIVSPVQALMVDKGRVGGEWGLKVEDPAMAAGQRFAELLKKRGVKASAPKREKQPQAAQRIASVSSVPVHEIVGEALGLSDNDTAEHLLRLAGIGAGYGGSFEGGAKAVRDALESVGVSTAGAVFVDGSGLSKLNQIPPRLLVGALRLAVNGGKELSPIASGLPVAGVSGTLKYRFAQPTTKSAAGWVRGKTGTLNYVSGLAGFVQSRSGRVLVFATIANEAKSVYAAAMNIDRIASEVANCGCPGDGR